MLSTSNGWGDAVCVSTAMSRSKTSCLQARSADTRLWSYPDHYRKCQLIFSQTVATSVYMPDVPLIGDVGLRRRDSSYDRASRLWTIMQVRDHLRAVGLLPLLVPGRTLYVSGYIRQERCMRIGYMREYQYRISWMCDVNWSSAITSHCLLILEWLSVWSWNEVQSSICFRHW